MSVSVENETDALQYPVTNVFCCLKVRLEHQTDSHRIATLWRHVHRRPERVLHYIIIIIIIIITSLSAQCVSSIGQIIKSVCVSVSEWVSEWILGPPSISRERLKLETSNLARRLASGVLTNKWKIRSKGVVNGSRDLLLKFCNPLHISRTVEARNFKFGMACILATSGPRQKIQNQVKKGRDGVTWPTSRMLGSPPYFENGLS